MTTRAQQIAQLRQARERLGLTPRQLAKRIGVHARTVKRWEAGEYDIHEAWLMRIDDLVKQSAEVASR